MSRAAVPDLDLLPQHRRVELGPRPDPAAGAEDDARAHRRARLDPAAGADHHGPPNPRRRGDGRRRVDPSLGTLAALRLHVGPEAARQEVLLRLEVLGGRADVDPVARRDEAVEGHAPLEEQRKELALHRVRLPLGDPLEELPLEHVDARVDGVRRDLFPAGLLQEAMHAAVGLELDEAVGGGVLDGHEIDRRRRAAGLVRPEHRGEVELREHVPVHDDHAPVDEVGGVPHAARRAERVPLDDVPQPDLPEALPGHDLPDRLGPVRDGQDHVPHAVGAEQPELVGEERHVQQRDDRLRPLEGQRPEPGPQAPGQDDGLDGHTRPPAVRGDPGPAAPSRPPR